MSPQGFNGTTGKPKYEKPIKIRWFNGVPFGGLSNKEVYMEQMIEYHKTIKRRKKNEDNS